MKLPNDYKKTLVCFVTVFLLAGLFVYFGYALSRSFSTVDSDGYQVIQLTTGDTYYGRLRIFPCCRLTEAYFVQNVSSADEEEDVIIPQLSSLGSMFFGPENTMYLQKEQVLWWANLSEDSEILKTMRKLREGSLLNDIWFFY